MRERQPRSLRSLVSLLAVRGVWVSFCLGFNIVTALCVHWTGLCGVLDLVFGVISYLYNVAAN